MMEMLQEGVLGEKAVWENLVSTTRIDEFHNTIRVIKKRLRLGEDFQAAITICPACSSRAGFLRFPTAG